MSKPASGSPASKTPITAAMSFFCRERIKQNPDHEGQTLRLAC
jgi:hypothetical protein